MIVPILITSAGRRVGLSRAFREAARALGCEARIVAADYNPELSAACALADVWYRVPRVTDPEYVPALLEICARESVRLLVPTIDPELLPLALSAARFSEAGIRVHVADPDFVGLARDKLSTMQRLRARGIPTPATATGLGELRFPVIIKPRGGSSSVGLKVVRSQRECAGIDLPGDCIIQELLDGPEFTVNVFYDQSGGFRCAVPHRRLEVRGGEMSKGRTERNADLTEIARLIGSTADGVRGAFCFQAMLTQDGPVVFEINARFGGGYPLADHAGGRFAKWLLEEVLGMACTADDEWRDQVTALRYDTEAYV